MSKTNQIPEGLSEADVQYLIDNPGTVLSGAAGEQSTVFESSTHVDISTPAAKGIRPRISGNTHDVTAGRISRPSSGLAQRLADGHAKLRAEAAAQAEQHHAQLAVVDPSKLNDRIAYLERALKRAEKNIRELKAEVKSDASKE